MESYEKPSLLLVGATGRMGVNIAYASLKQGYPTYILTRSLAPSDPGKAELLQTFKELGAHVLEGSLEDRESLVAALKKVEIVISTISEEKLLDQLKLIDAIKEAGNIKRFIPSEFGSEIDRVHNVLEPVEVGVLGPKRKIRRAIEDAGSIPYTFVIANGMANIFLAALGNYGRTTPPTDEVVILGDGNARVIWVDEVDIATYTLKAMIDPQTVNRKLHIRPATNTLSLNEVVGIWETKLGKTLEKTFVPEEQFVKRIEMEEYPIDKRLAICHMVFIKGVFDLELNDSDLDASKLYPDVKCTTVDSYLDRFLAYI